jgi:uncharacterized repeat protein (TIGR01451 family)
MTQHQPNNSQLQPGTKMEDNSIVQQGRALLRQSARQIRKSENSKFQRITASSLAMAVVAMQVMPAFATINNTVTASGFGPGLAPVSGGASASVDVANALPTIGVLKTATFATPLTDDLNGNGLADPGDKITYTYIVTNSGNVTLKNVFVTDAHDGAGTPPAIIVPTSVTTDLGTPGDSSDPVTTDSDWGVLGPKDVITFKSTYTVVAADITAAGGGTGVGLSTLNEPDGYIDNTATVKGTYNNTSAGTTTDATNTSRANFKLNVLKGITITKVPDQTTNVPAGTLITYTYTVTNTGNVPVTTITLADTHNGVPGALTPAFQSFTTNVGGLSLRTGNIIDILQPGDVAKYTATYTVTQADVDNRQ